MLQQDYLLRMFLQIATAIRESLQRSRGEQDPEAAASLLDQSLRGCDRDRWVAFAAHGT